jgi:hypothetical protein
MKKLLNHFKVIFIFLKYRQNLDNIQKFEKGDAKRKTV